MPADEENKLVNIVEALNSIAGAIDNLADAVSSNGGSLCLEEPLRKIADAIAAEVSGAGVNIMHGLDNVAAAIRERG
jgi:hypothetical protein